MEESMLILKCKVSKEDGSKFNYENFYNILEENGFTLEGGVDEVSKNDIRNLLEELKASMTDEIIETMIGKVMDFYNDDSPLDTYGFFETNFCTVIFESVIRDNLSNDMKDKFDEINGKWWEISDEVQSELGDVVCEYIDKHYKSE